VEHARCGELVDGIDLHPAAGGPGLEVLRTAADRRGGEVRALSPAPVARPPQMDHGVVAHDHGEPVVLVHHLEAQPLVVDPPLPQRRLGRAVLGWSSRAACRRPSLR